MVGRSDLEKLGWVVRYLPHGIMADYNATYNVEYEGQHVTTKAAERLGIPLNEIWISEMWRPCEKYILFHEFREIQYRARGLEPEEAHRRAMEDGSEAWKGDPLYERMLQEIRHADLMTAVRRAKETLSRHGYVCDASEADLRRYFEAETPYPGISLDEVLQSDFLVIHEIVEIDEIKRRGLQLTKDVIMKNLETVYEAHLKAAEIELDLAQEAGDLEHIRNRLEDIRNWCEDPLLPPALSARCEELYARMRALLSQAADTSDA